MHQVRRGTVVGDASGKQFVVWGRCGTLAHLMPVLKVGTIPCRGHIVRVRATMAGDTVKVLAVDAEARRHIQTTALMPLGEVSADGLARLASDVKAQKHDATIRDNRQWVHDTVGREARRARARSRAKLALVDLARTIVSEMWPEQMAA